MHFLRIVSTENTLNYILVKMYANYDWRYVKSTPFVQVSIYLAIK
jgi:hypothetical protein